jgi:hypothetical protein
MYQTLICRVVRRNGGRHEARGLTPPLHTKLFERSANPLVDRMGTYAQSGRDFLAVVMPVDQQEAFDLPLAESRDGRIRTRRTARPFNTIGYHQEHQHSFRAGNKCRNQRFPALLLIESAEMLK